MSGKRKKYDRLLETDWIGPGQRMTPAAVKRFLGRMKRLLQKGTGVAQIVQTPFKSTRRPKSGSRLTLHREPAGGLGVVTTAMRDDGTKIDVTNYRLW